MPPKYKKFVSKPGSAKTTQFQVKASARYLVIVESPSKCRKIEEYLGEEYQCIASKGHIRHIDGLKSIDVKNNFHIEFSIIAEKKQHVDEMRKIIREFPQTSIFLASDDDREGEAIAWHICDVFGLSPITTKRILFHEITKPAITEAIKKPTLINMSLVYAQHARQVLDLIVGYKISPTLWKHIHNNKTNGLSAGRCQTPALKLVYENEMQAKDKMGENLEVKWKTSAVFFSTNTKFELKRDFVKQSQIEMFMEKSRNFDYTISVGSPKKAVKGAPRPFNTSQLLQTTNNLLHYSPKTTMDLCQQLYQSGLITYMRTDSQKYSPVFLAVARAHIKKEYGEKFVGELAKIENLDAGTPHEAIRVTNLETVCIDGDKLLQSMYRLIWKNTVESCMADAVYNNTCVAITAPSVDDLTQDYEHVIEMPVFLGWKRVFVGDEVEEKTKAAAVLLFMQSIALGGQPFQHVFIESLVNAQQRHSHYSEASLISKLEDLGIGRPSTFASIVETIQERGYVKKTDIDGVFKKCVEYKLRGKDEVEKIEREKVFGAEKGKLAITPTGILCLEFLVANFEKMFSYEYTSKMELKLDVISAETREAAETGWTEMCAECLKEIKELLKPVAKLGKQTYPLENGYELFFTQYGAALRRPVLVGGLPPDGNTAVAHHQVSDTDSDSEVDESPASAMPLPPSSKKRKVSTKPKWEYRSVKKNIKIDMEKLKRGEYSVADLIAVENENLGMYQEKPVHLKSGKYGVYVVWGTGETAQKISVKCVGKPMESIGLDDVIPFIKQKNMMVEIMGVGEKVDLDIDLSAIGDSYKTKSSGVGSAMATAAAASGIVRVLNANTSIRTGKYGDYVYYKTPAMKKPGFYGLKGFKLDYKTCEFKELAEFVKTKHKATI